LLLQRVSQTTELVEEAAEAPWRGAVAAAGVQSRVSSWLARYWQGILQLEPQKPVWEETSAEERHAGCLVTVRGVAVEDQKRLEAARRQMSQCQSLSMVSNPLANEARWRERGRQSACKAVHRAATAARCETTCRPASSISLARRRRSALCPHSFRRRKRQVLPPPLLQTKLEACRSDRVVASALGRVHLRSRRQGVEHSVLRTR
jgi:hypothetical protein